MEPTEAVNLAAFLRVARILCYGATPRFVMEALISSFADQWDFVHFAEEQKLGFDLAGPPKIRQPSELKFH